MDVEQSSDGRTAYFDVNAEAVRKNREIPDRPIRLTFDKASVKGGSPVWTLESVEELAPGVKSNGVDRDPDKPKRNVPWPDQAEPNGIFSELARIMHQIRRGESTESAQHLVLE